MNRLDPLELELTALRPCEPSPQLKQNIHQQINEQVAGVDRRSPPQHRAAAALHPSHRLASPSAASLWQRAALAAALLAASVLAVMAWRGEVRPQSPLQNSMALEAGQRAAFDRSSPSLWSYRQALCQSTESMDGLLDKHASHSLEPKRSAPHLVLARFSFQTNSFTGEL